MLFSDPSRVAEQAPAMASAAAPGRSSLFSIVTGSLRRRQHTEVQEPQRAEPIFQDQPVAAPAQPGTDEHYDVPAFLRRQSS